MDIYAHAMQQRYLRRKWQNARLLTVQSLLVSMKEIYGWLLFVAIMCLFGLMVRYSGIIPRKVIEPTYRAIYKSIRHDMLHWLRPRKRNIAK